VRQALKRITTLDSSQYHFYWGEHNTTTDEILLFDSEIPDSHKTNCKVEIKFAKKRNKRQLKKGWPLPIIVLLC
jgi:uncharacterized protein YbcC (UPF0753/DUF2309 family)